MNTPIPTINKIRKEDLPALFRTSDQASKAAQKQFALLTAASLVLLIVAAIIGSFALTNNSDKATLAIATAVTLVFSTALTVVILVSKLEKVWYDGRAIAESAKTLTWRYMTCTEPYHSTLKDEANKLFVSDLMSLLNQRKAFASRLGGKSAMERQITDAMKQMRNLCFEERKRLYISERIDDQRKWYSGKAEANQKSVYWLFAAIVISQVLAVISAIAMVRWPELSMNPTSILITLATAFLAWMQMRRHQELAQSYGLAAQNLGFIHEQGIGIKTEDELSMYVVNSENAISREHTMWLARRCVD